MTFFETIRGVEIEVHAEDWYGDPSVGIEYGPETVYARTLDGEDFELTDEETEKLTSTAIKASWDDFPDYYPN